MALGNGSPYWTNTVHLPLSSYPIHSCDILCIHWAPKIYFSMSIVVFQDHTRCSSCNNTQVSLNVTRGIHEKALVNDKR